jgi:hypothetical protein
MTVEAYPLHWPPGWPRTKPYDRASDNRFGGHGKRLTMGRTIVQLVDELRLLGATKVVVSSNIPTRGNGLPYAEYRLIDDPGIACYFWIKGRPLVMARDGFISPAGNVRSLTLAIEGLRQLERHGGSVMLERAFEGFLAIAPPDHKKPWRQVFGLTPDWRGSISQVTALFRAKAKDRHPDAGGSDTLMAELNIALREARDELEAKAA